MAGPPIVVRPDDVAARRSAAQEALRKADLPASFGAAAPGPYGISHAALWLLEALEASLAAGIAAEGALLARIATDRAHGFAAGEPTTDERRFAASLGALVACEEALAATASTSSAALPERPFTAAEVCSVLGPGFAAALAKDLVGYVEHYRSHTDAGRRLGSPEQLAACVRSHLARMALAARSALSEQEHAAAATALGRTPLAIPGGATYAGLDRQATLDDEPVELLDVTPADIVGNADVLAAGLKLARAVASFDVGERRNPRQVENPVLFVLGTPGCGKTVTAHAVGRHFLELCAGAGVPARFRVIRRTDWASHYQNKSASDLLRIFREEIFGFHGVAGCYWPDIDTAFAARSGPDVRAEEKANLATLFGILDGTIGPRNGQWFLICDANYMDMDDAMVSRLTQDPKVANGPESAADYVRLLRDVKLRGLAEHLPPPEAWDAIGEALRRARMSGRAVAAVAGRIKAEIHDVPEPDGFFRMSFEEKRAALRALAKPVTGERILEHAAHYERFEREAAERAHRERFDRRVEELRLQLSAHAAAVGARPDDVAP